MRKFLLPPLLLCLVLPFFSCQTTGEGNSPETLSEFINSDPIILLYGLNGFARDNFDNYWYWGGLTDLEAELRRAGYDVRTACVGPVSSNWDRSCDFYACLKGGTVDYGESHSSHSGHSRFGKTYEGIYPEWGEADPVTGEPRRIHIIAHSMGGTTARMVAQLLEEGSLEEKGASPSELSPLFRGGHSWIKSITTLSTPHDGTTLTYEMTSYRQRDLIADLALGFLVKWDRRSLLHNDLQLDHWSWTLRRVGESQDDYTKRIDETVMEWNWTNKDFADFDLKPEGAWEMNGWVEARPGIYYFSWATRITYTNGKGEEKNHPLISLPLIPLSDVLSHYRGYRSSLIQIDSSWLPNDGVVNSVSMDGPTLNSGDKIVRWNGVGIPEKGQWNYRGEMYPLDHMQVIGMSPLINPPDFFPGTVEWFAEQAAFLSALP